MPRLSIFTEDEINLFDKPPRFSSEQRQKYFHLSDKLILLLRNLRSATNKVCTVLQWGYFRASGRFFSIDDFHLADLRYVTQILNVSHQEINLKGYREKRKITVEHQRMILKAMNFRPLDVKTKSWLQTQLESLASKHMQPREMIYYLASQCYQQQIEIPTYHYFAEHITQIYNSVENRLITIVKNNITDKQKNALVSLLPNDSSKTILLSDWKSYNQSLKVKDIQSDIEIFIQIKETFHTISPLLKALSLSPSSSEYYATWVKKAKTSQLIQIPEKAKLFLHLAAFIQHQFYSRQDAFIDIFLHSVQNALNKAKNKRISNEQSQRAERTKLIQKLVDEQDLLEALILDITNVVAEDTLTDSKKIARIKLLIQQHQDVQTTIRQQGDYHSQKEKIRKLLTDDTYYNFLEEASVSLQRYVNNIVKVVEFNQETSEQKTIEAIRYFKNNDGNVDQYAPIEFLESKQLAVVYEANKKLRVSLYKILLFAHMLSCIKSGGLNLAYSYNYKAIQDYLISKEQWQSNKQKLLESAGLNEFADINQIISKLKIFLDESYRRVNQEIIRDNNPYIRFEPDGKFILTTPKVEKKNTDTISDILSNSGFIPIVQVLSDINRVSQFTGSFKHYSIKNQKLKPTAEMIIAGLMAKGHNIGIHKISHISVGINSNTLRQTVNWFLTLPNIQSANHRIIALINKIALSNVFRYKPGTTHTSSDGQKYYVAVDSLLANYSFKYFGKDKGVSVYTFVDDKQSLFYSTVISASEREAAYVIDGLLHNTVVKSDIHSTDMHGFTESIFAATHFIGTSFAPRFKKLNRQQIYGFSARQTYANKNYKILPSRTINSNLILESWDDVLRFMVTVKL